MPKISGGQVLEVLWTKINSYNLIAHPQKHNVRHALGIMPIVDCDLDFIPTPQTYENHFMFPTRNHVVPILDNRYGKKKEVDGFCFWKLSFYFEHFLPIIGTDYPYLGGFFTSLSHHYHHHRVNWQYDGNCLMSSTIILLWQHVNALFNKKNKIT
jgi:hypothetical protein